ncbi:MAG: HAMP domain-containing protein [Nitrospirae bacterium]|nr:MAG: HAMP domain-containing protein [Nitrospirota bacterium]
MRRALTVSRLSVHHKVVLILAVMVLPVLAMVALYLTTIRQLLAVQEEVDRLSEIQVQTEAILSIAVDVEDGFRGFVLVHKENFLEPFNTAESAFDPAIGRLKQMVRDDPEQLQRVSQIEARVLALVQKKKRLIDAIRLGDLRSARAHIESGEGPNELIAIREGLRDFENVEKQWMSDRKARAERLALVTRYGLGGVVIGILFLWWLASRLLARTITGPLATLTVTAQEFGSGRPVARIPVDSTDEVGRLARTMEEMQERIARHISQMEAFHAIGREISTIGPDGLEGVLKRMAETAGSMLRVDLCLVLLWDETIGFWKVGAASGHWHDLLRRSVLIREETPISFKALTTGVPQVVDDLEASPELVSQIRDRLGGKSLLAVPLVGPEGAFGVLAFAPTREKRVFTDWEIRLSQQFAVQAAIAILNTRLYEAAQQRGEGLQNRLEELERYASNMAHDLKGPARRMAELASLLHMDYQGRFDERADRYLGWIRETGQQLMSRIEEVLRLARLGTVREAVGAVDPAEVARDVVKGCEGLIERQGARVHMADWFPKLACSRVHLFQVLDNLVRNALNFSVDGRPPDVEIGVVKRMNETALFVRDNGIGIPSSEVERIFEPFARLGHKDVPGTGIGLTIVKKIIELYNGRVWVESEPDKGATFFFTFPLYVELTAEPVRHERGGS